MAQGTTEAKTEQEKKSELEKKNQQIVKIVNEQLQKGADYAAQINQQVSKKITDNATSAIYQKMFATSIKLRTLLVYSTWASFEALNDRDKESISSWVRYDSYKFNLNTLNQSVDKGLRKEFFGFVMDFSKLVVAFQAFMYEVATNNTITAVDIENHEWMKGQKIKFYWDETLRDFSDRWPFIPLVVAAYNITNYNSSSVRDYNVQLRDCIAELVVDLQSCKAINYKTDVGYERSIADRVFNGVEDFVDQVKRSGWDAAKYYVQRIIRTGSDVIFGDIEDKIRSATENAFNYWCMILTDNVPLTKDSSNSSPLYAIDDYVEYGWNTAKKWVSALINPENPDRAKINPELPTVRQSVNPKKQGLYGDFEKERLAIASLLYTDVLEYMNRLAQARAIQLQENAVPTVSERVTHEAQTAGIKLALEAGANEKAADLFIELYDTKDENDLNQRVSQVMDGSPTQSEKQKNQVVEDFMLAEEIFQKLNAGSSLRSKIAKITAAWNTAIRKISHGSESIYEDSDTNKSWYQSYKEAHE